MSIITLEPIERSEAIINLLCANCGHLILLDAEGVQLWESSPHKAQSSTPVERFKLTDVNDELHGTVELHWNGDINSTTLAAIQQLIKSWEQEWALVHELDGMASELTDRYEELNLLYKPSEKNSDRQNNESEQIETLLAECVDKLSLDFAIAMQSDFGMFHIASRENTKPLYSDREYLSILKQKSSPYAETQMAVIMNSDAQNPNSKPMDNQHAIFSPLQPSPSNSLGGLWFFRTSEKTKFFNSDSRLATSIASEITSNLLKHHDTTTGLLNRSGFEKSLQRYIDLGSEINPSVIAYINIQRFSIVNDHGGYTAGDQLLKHFSLLLNEYFRETDVVARLVADEFVVSLKTCNSDQAIKRLHGFLAKVAKQPFLWKEQSFPISLAVGLSPLSSHESANTCIKDASAACDLAAQNGANQVLLFDGKDKQYQRYASERQTVPLLHTALAENQFLLYAQPIYAIKNGKTLLSHAEILVRLHGKDNELVSPAMFVPVAERFGLMSDIDMWIFKHSIEALENWQQHNTALQNKLSINLSGRTLTTDYASEILRLLSLSSIKPCQICFEITETAALIDMDTAVNFINRLRAIGCSFALDDFGSGLSSFTYLKNLPVDYLKIDGSFVKNIVKEPASRTFVESINTLSHALGLKTIAEFVADQGVLDALAELHVDFAQGYHCSPPMPLAEYFDLLTETQLNKIA